MIKEALQYIAGLKEQSMEPIIKEINGKTYCNKDLTRYDEEPMARPIEARTLTSLVDYIKNKRCELRGSMVVHIVNPKAVELYSGLTKERRREKLFISTAEIPRFNTGEWLKQEQFIIDLQANFEVTADLEAILKVAGNVEAKTTANYGDDGISQKTTIKQGIASKTDVLVPNPVTLTPYRTFLEVEQPASQFVFRIKDMGGEAVFKLVEAEGGLWKNQAMQNIKMYLEEQLKDIAEREQITIIA